MTGIDSSRNITSSAPARYDDPSAPSGWVGWILFATVMMTMVGVFQIIEGLVALFNQAYWQVKTSDLLVNVSYSAWGWTHLVLGILLIAAGLGLTTGHIVARALAVVLAALSAIVNLAFMSAYPLWSLLIIVIDVLVIFAVTVHGRELKLDA